MCKGHPMIDTQLYFGTEELDGTMYYEYQPGHEARQHWRADSVYLAESAQAMIEPLCVQLLLHYDPWGVTTLRATNSAPFIEALRACSVSTLQRVWPPLTDEKACKELILTYAKLATWLERTFKSHEAVSLLGL